MQQAGVAVQWIEYPGLVHGFANILCSQSARDAVNDMGSALRDLMRCHSAG